MRGNKETQKLKLEDAQCIPNYYFKKSQASKLGMPWLASHISSSTTIG